MTNPIISQLQNSPGSLLSRISDIKRIISGQNPEYLYRQLMTSNPGFSDFVSRNQGKTVEQIAAEHGFDINEIRSLLR